MKTFRKRIGILILVFILIVILGTFSYHKVEGWRYLDSFYFTFVTVATIGYGDFTPQTDLGKIFTVFFSLTGIIMIFVLISMIGDLLIGRHFQRHVETHLKRVSYNNRLKKRKR